MSRSTLIPVAPVNIGQVVRNAVVFNFSRHRNRQEFMDANNIPAEVEELFYLLEARQIPFLLVGGIAMLAHVRGRNTDDVDLILSVPDQHRLEPEVTLADPGSPFAMGRFKQLRVNYLDAGTPFFGLVRKRYSESRRFDFLRGDRELPCATPEGLMLLKLYALPSVTQQMDWDRANTYEDDLHKLWLTYPQLEPRKLLPVLKPFVWDGGLFSLENEVVPALEQRRARFLRVVAEQERQQQSANRASENNPAASEELPSTQA